MAKGTLPGSGSDAALDAPGAPVAVRPALPESIAGIGAADAHAPVTAAVDVDQAGSARTAIARVEERLDTIDSRLRMLEDRFDDMIAELRTLGADLTAQTERQQHNATKEWITWAVVTILVVILGAMWWAFKIYILPGHHQML